jgi:hypothetical protein
MKKCIQCKKSLPQTAFVKNGKEYKQCNKCREYASAWQKKDRKKNPAPYKKAQQKYRAANLDTVRKKDRAAQKKRRADHPEECKLYRESYQKKNKKKNQARDKDRMLNRPEYFLFSSARYRAKKRKLEFNITEQDIIDLLNKTKQCPLRKVSFTRGQNGKANDNSISLDRSDNTKGYIKGNIQIISYRANIIKNNLTLLMFKNIVIKLKQLIVQEHAIDNKTLEYILQDREKQIIKGNREKDHYRLMNIENSLLRAAKTRAKKSKIEFDIDLNYIKSIWPLDNKCPVLGKSFVFGKNVVSDLSATLDRIDNTKGYVKGNIMILSNKVNVVKNKATLEELEIILKNWTKLEIKRNK